jgi:DNA-binding response OmpR family regulator
VPGWQELALKTDRNGAYEAGCDDYDVKPIDFPRLLTKIEKQLRMQQQFGA